MRRSFACRPQAERDGVWFADRFNQPPTERHYETTARALTESGQRPETLPPPPRQFGLLEELKSRELQHPFTMHDNRYIHMDCGEILRGRHRKRRPCCVRPLHTTSDPLVFVDSADPPASPEQGRLQTVARQAYSGAAPDSCGAAPDSSCGVTPSRRRLYSHQIRCPFPAGVCQHDPAEQRRCEPASTGPAAAE